MKKTKPLTYYSIVCDCCGEPLTVLHDKHITIFKTKKAAQATRSEYYETKDTKILKTTIKLK